MEPMGVHNVVSSSNVHRISVTGHFCEFNKTGTAPHEECYHITCLYKRGNAQNSTLVQQSSTNSEFKNHTESKPSLSSEKHLHEEKARRRCNKHAAILRNGPVDFSWLKLSFYTVGIVFFGALSTFPMALVPGHDLVKCPEYWYEILYHASVITIGTSLLNCCLTSYFLNMHYTLKFKNIANITLIAILLVYTVVVITYYMWTGLLSYQYPIPFLGNALFWVLTLPFFIMMWLNFPKEWRQDDEFRNRMKYYIAFWAIMILVIIISRVAIDAVKQYEQIIVFTFIATREMLLWIDTRIIERTSDADLVGAKIVSKYYILVGHSILLCSLLASHLSDYASWGLIGADFCINILKCIRFIWIRFRTPARIHKQIDILQDLVICELVEFQAPLSFMLTFICAYYGPNGNLFGNILNGYWDFVATDDLNQKLSKWTFYFLADFSSMIVTSVCLWHSFKINVFKILLDLQQEFWPGFSVILGSLLTHVS